MARSIRTVLVAAACRFALIIGQPVHAQSMKQNMNMNMNTSKVIIAFGTMYGVDEAFVGDANPIRGVVGDELPWQVRSIRGRLDVTGHLKIRVRGLVFTNDDIVPPDLRLTNDETDFRALVSCLSEDGDTMTTQNVMTEGFPSTPSGNSDIDAHITLPSPCVAPIVFVMSGSEDKWFAVTGFETEAGGDHNKHPSPKPTVTSTTPIFPQPTTTQLTLPEPTFPMPTFPQPTFPTPTFPEPTFPQQTFP